MTIEVFIGFRRRYQGFTVDDLHQAYVEIPNESLDDDDDPSEVAPPP